MGWNPIVNSWEHRPQQEVRRHVGGKHRRHCHLQAKMGPALLLVLASSRLGFAAAVQTAMLRTEQAGFEEMLLELLPRAMRPDLQVG